MKLVLERTYHNTNATVGTLSIDGAHECFTLEDVIRPPGVKIPGKTAIPAGTYGIALTYSNRFGQRAPYASHGGLVPILQNVPNFEGVRIHCGNTDADTDGCILVGQSIEGEDFIGGSRDAYASLFGKIQAAIVRGESVSITIS